MSRWKARAYLVIFAAVCIAGALVVPFVSPTVGRDVLAGGLLLGSLAMLTVALIGLNGHDKD